MRPGIAPCSTVARRGLAGRISIVKIGVVRSTRPVWLKKWLERHQSGLSLTLHLIGIPAVAAALLLGLVQLLTWRWDLWWRPALLFVAGYVLQCLGHVWEGNDMGEVILVKRLLGRPYIAISSRYDNADDAGKDSSIAQ